jgi:translation elongation factor EF-Ts
MANIELLKKLRDLTQAGMMDAKKALDENHDDLDAAVQ